MKAVFADTSFYVALLNARDIAHQKAVQISQRIEWPVLLTDFIVLELGNALSGPDLRKLFTKLLADLRSDPAARIVPASRELMDRGLELFSRRADSWFRVEIVPVRRRWQSWEREVGGYGQPGGSAFTRSRKAAKAQGNQ